MRRADIAKTTITGQIYRTIFAILDDHPEGIRWAELQREIARRDPSFHPKTVNGCVWKLVETFPEDVEKPEKGLFRLIQP